MIIYIYMIIHIFIIIYINQIDPEPPWCFVPLPDPTAFRCQVHWRVKTKKGDVSRCERGTPELSDSTILLHITNILLTVYTHKIYT